LLLFPASREAFAKAITTIAKENAITLPFFHQIGRSHGFEEK
jgi:hypothetical protein